MGKTIIIGIIVAAAVFALTNLGIFNRGAADNPGFKVVEATSKASEQAGHLIKVFDSVNPYSVPVPPPGGASPQDASASNSEDTEETGNINIITSPADTAVKDAYNWMVYYANSSGVDSNHKYIESANVLRDEWTPRYKQARTEYNKLNHRVEFTKNTAEEYFGIQKNLTSQIQDATTKEQMRENDRKEIEAYQIWATQADKTVLKAYELMQDLEDMDIIIAKLNLSAHFAALNSSAQALPASMAELHQELNYFRQASQDINNTFGFNQAAAAP